MQIPSLENIYIKINKQILLAEAYTNFKNLSFIIKSCRLIPLPYIKNKKHTIILQKHWVDEFGNSLKIVKGKKLQLIYNDLSIDKNKLGFTDLYFGLPLNKILKISKLAYICAGIDEDNFEERYYICLLGIDNYFRTFMFDGEWSQISTLHLGMNNLKLIADKRDIKYFLQFNNLKNMPYPCIRAKQWLTSLPASKKCLEDISQDFPDLSEILRTK